MLKNILVTSLRNFFRHGFFSLINLVGLSVSMSLGMLMIMIIREQLTFDNFHLDSDRIYRVNTRLLERESESVDYASAPLPLALSLKDDYSFTEQVVRIKSQFKGDAIYGNVNFPMSGLWVDPSFLEVFNFPFSKGDPQTALNEPGSLVLTGRAATKLFGAADPIGQTISLNGYGDFMVTGVLQDFVSKTHFDFEMLCSVSALRAFEKAGTVGSSIDNWSAYRHNYVYFKLKEGHDVAEAERALAAINNHSTNLKSEGRNIGYEFYLQPLSKITPGPELSGQMGGGMPDFFLIFMGVFAGIVLLMSVFNFTNLTIAKSLSRAREIGVRKVAGASRHQVFLQFIGEAVVFSLIALVFSYILLQVLKSGFLSLSLNEDFVVDLKEDFSLHIVFILFAISVGILAGVLPAAYLSAFKPSRVLKDVQNLKVYGRLTFRKVLMTVQFTLSVIFVVVVVVMYRQVDFMISADYGIDQKNKLNLYLQGVAFEKIAHDISALPGVISVGGVSHKLGIRTDASGNYKKDKNAQALLVHEFMVDDTYVANLSLTFLAGHNFEVQQGRIDQEVILNETAVSLLGFRYPLDAVGQTIHVNDTVMMQIVGVVRDFHFRPLNSKIGPLALRYDVRKLNFLSVRIDPMQKQSVVASVTALWKKYDPVHAVDLMMMDEEIDDAYRQAGMSDVIVMVGYIAMLVISLACLGMLGMAMYAAQIRAKEMGIRKVMGASAADVMMLLSRSFMILIGVAIIVGLPVSLMLGRLFLEGFAYRIQITPLLLAASIGVIVVIGLMTVWSQTLRVAISDPVKWLRHE